MAKYHPELIDNPAEHPATSLDANLHAHPSPAPGAEGQLLAEWNRTAEDYPRNRCVHELVATQAKRRPNAVAVGFGCERLSYEQLDRRANQLARHLRKLGVGPDSLVAILAGRSPQMIVGLLGILKAGGAYLPLDPAYPQERLAFMLKDAGVGILLTQESLRGRVPERDLRVVSLDGGWHEIARQRTVAPKNTAGPESLAYVIYTSGSTGTPKGVQIPHRALVNFLSSMAKRPGMSEEDILLAVTTLSFDIAGLELFLPLTVGARVEIVTRETASDGKRLSEKLAASRITVMQATPATWRLLVESGWQGSSRLKILCGGEPLSRELANQLLTRSCSLWNMYGPTETTIWSSVYRITSETGPILIGRPIANTQFYVLDGSNNSVPAGVTGELHIGGDGLARGYLGRPDLTAEKFVRNPFSNDPAARLYKTGDLARFLPDGNVEFFGRIDHQIKIRGFRVELGEIEAALTGHPLVMGAAVTCEDSAGEKSIVAYVVPVSGSPLTAEELLRSLRQKLPVYMLPSRFVFLRALPLTPNGKVDRRSLSQAANLEPKSEPSWGVQPRSVLEGQILRIWEEILETKALGVQDDFFEAGGNSLLAVRLISRIQEVCGAKLPLGTLFAGATVEHLANAVLNAGNEKFRSRLVEVQAGDSKEPFFFCHGDYSGGSYCRRLAMQLGKDRPFYAISPHGLDGENIPSTIEAMAADNLRALLECRTRRPYLLGGYSNGALVAFEMARQMQERGLTPDLLVLVDAPGTNVRFRWRRRLLRYLGRLLGLSHEEQTALFLRGRDFFYVLSELAEQGRRAQLLFILNKLRRARPKSSAPDPAQSPAQNRLANGRGSEEKLLACLRAVDGYVPEPYQGRVVFLRTDSMQSSTLTDATAGWGRVAKQVEVYWLPGDHRAAVTDQVDLLAEHLTSSLCAFDGSPATAVSSPRS